MAGAKYCCKCNSSGSCTRCSCRQAEKLCTGCVPMLHNRCKASILHAGMPPVNVESPECSDGEASSPPSSSPDPLPDEDARSDGEDPDISYECTPPTAKTTELYTADPRDDHRILSSAGSYCDISGHAQGHSPRAFWHKRRQIGVPPWTIFSRSFPISLYKARSPFQLFDQFFLWPCNAYEKL